ncbi:MAG TPA: amylo-alpha-1,6-glucosidase [Actinomycetota bacterium]|jgi:glycogen debranching enzyme|nr:amylo-alpha-1,6-glucosidase [Actinomycetota bacterium]
MSVNPLGGESRRAEVESPPGAERPEEGVSPVLITDLASKTLAVKEGDAFLYSDLEGNLEQEADYGLGLYSKDTRFLSRFRLTINGRAPVLLSSSSERGYMSHVDLTNPDLYDEKVLAVPQQTLNIRRIRAISGRLFERVRMKNYNPFPVTIDVEFAFGADFADIFEVRGMTRDGSQPPAAPKVEDGRIDFVYEGRDGVRRITRIEFGARADRIDVDDLEATATFRVHLGPYQTKLIGLSVDPIIEDGRPSSVDFDHAVHELRRSYEEWERESTQVVTDNELFNELLDRSLRDLRALYTQSDGGAVLAAGIPWYVAVFGRDSLIASHQLLMVNTRPARDALELLASKQGTIEDDWRDEEPGKILHEIRQGELARAGLIPHSPYYGSVDATPWFVLLYAQHFRWTGDLEFAEKLLPAAQAALAWIDEYGDLDGDGFVEYLSRSPRGIKNQGWKDSYDSVVHADGRLAEPPIALCEVQAYVYLAKQRMGDVYRALGRDDDARRLEDEAAALRAKFNEAFWMGDEKYFAQALDADKRQVRTITSNPGHALYCGIVDDEKAVPLAKRLLSPDMFSGWGIRTMSKAAAAYNPMSYHNGSVWPHDNALIAAGLKRYGMARSTNRVSTALFDAAVNADYMRLPELFCGFTRRTPNRPVSYPVACSPQAWAAGSPFLMLQAMLGISARAHQNLLTVNLPHLPTWLNTVEVRNLAVGDSRISVVFRREGEITSFSLLSREGDVRVVMEE